MADEDNLNVSTFELLRHSFVYSLQLDDSQKSTENLLHLECLQSFGRLSLSHDPPIILRT